MRIQYVLQNGFTGVAQLKYQTAILKPGFAALVQNIYLCAYNGGLIHSDSLPDAQAIQHRKTV